MGARTRRISFSVQDLATCVGGRVQGHPASCLRDIAPLDAAEPHHLSFAESRKQLASVAQSRAGALLVNADLAQALPGCPRPLIVVDDPQRAIIEAMLLFRPQRARPQIGISETAVVSPSARLGQDCNVFPGALIGEDVTIGDRCDIGPGVVIGGGCVIGDECVLHAHAVLYPDVSLGRGVIVHANSVIGADGFGYRFVEGALVKIPHRGTVIIEDDVEIGACATIDRAMIGATIIGRGTKLDNLVMVAHNCRVGRHNAFASHVGLAGSVTTGDYVQMGGQAGIADHVHIAAGVKLGGKAGVMDDLPQPGIYHGIPALPEHEAKKQHIHLRKLPEMREQIKQLAARIAELEAKLACQSRPEPERSAA